MNNKQANTENHYMTGAALSSIRLYQADSLVFCLDWQEDQKISSGVKRMEKKLKTLAPALGLSTEEPDKDCEQKERSE